MTLPPCYTPPDDDDQPDELDQGAPSWGPIGAWLPHDYTVPDAGHRCKRFERWVGVGDGRPPPGEGA